MTDETQMCPDWRQLILRREVYATEESAEWREALEHRRECVRCQQASLEADPLMFLTGLPTADVSDHEIADMQARVAERRRVETAGPWRAWLRPSQSPVWLRTAAAAVALAATVGVVQLGWLPASWTRPSSPLQTADSTGASIEREDSLPDLPDDLALLPLFEGLDLREARVYQMTEGDLDLVMIVDGSLDI